MHARICVYVCESVCMLVCGYTQLLLLLLLFVIAIADAITATAVTGAATIAPITNSIIIKKIKLQLLSTYLTICIR